MDAKAAEKGGRIAEALRFYQVARKIIRGEVALDRKIEYLQVCIPFFLSCNCEFSEFISVSLNFFSTCLFSGLLGRDSI